MSESAKKKLVQKKLPFAVSVEIKTTRIPRENLSPNIAKQSRKRRPSNDGNNPRAMKRVAESKENIANQHEEVLDVAEMLVDDVIEHTGEVQVIRSASETPPTIVQREKALHIKLPSHSKSKRKVNMDLKPQKSIDESDEDGSVVYLDEEELQSAKKAKKSKKKKAAGSNRARRTLSMNKNDAQSVEVVELSNDESVSDDANKKVQSPSEKESESVELTANEEKSVEAPRQSIRTKVSKELTEDPLVEPIESIPTKEVTTDLIVEPLETIPSKELTEDPLLELESIPMKRVSEDLLVQPIESIPLKNVTKDPLVEPFESIPTKELTKEHVEERLESIPTKSSSPAVVDPDSIHDEIIEVLSDGSDNAADKISDPNKTPTAKKLDLKNLTPKQLARRQEQEDRRLEKEIQRQKERETKEQQRLLEKEQREEAKRKEKEEKEETRKKEKEERDRKRQVTSQNGAL